MADQIPSQIPSEFLSPQEHFFIGGGTVPGAGDPYVIHSISFLQVKPGSGLFDEVIEARKSGKVLDERLGITLGLRGPAVVSLSEIDSEGKTLGNPEILGSWDAEKREVITYEKRNLTREFVEMSRTAGTEIPMRGIEPPQDISRS